MKVEIKGNIFAQRSYSGEGFSFMFAECDDMKSTNEYFPDRPYVKVMPHAIEVDIPDNFDSSAQEVALLNEQKRAALDAYNRRVAQINEQLSKLQALEFSPS